MIRKIGTVIGADSLDDVLIVRAEGTIAQGDTVVIAGNRLHIYDLVRKGGHSIPKAENDEEFGLRVNFNPDLVRTGTSVWLINSQQSMIMSEAVVVEIFKDAEELGITLFEKLHAGQRIIIDNFGPFKIASLLVNGISRGTIHPGEPAGLKLEGFNFTRYARRGAEIFVVSEDGEDEDGQPAKIEEAVKV